MSAQNPYRQHLKSSADLVTSYAATRAGFVALALEKNRRATPFVEQARALKTAAARARRPEELLRLVEIQPALLTAAGVSDKAAGHLQPDDKESAIRGLIEKFLEPAGADFVEELVFRFLLTRGDTLGGAMRNVGGMLAQRKLSRALVSTLTLSGRPYQWLHSLTNTWAEGPEDNADVELHLRGLSWRARRRQRTLVYNLTVPLVKNNVDLCLFNGAPETLSAAVYQSPSAYVALGELKGGIDPAGADEHWKTARTALARIQKAFAREPIAPRTFFIGAAIEKKMADEIWTQLVDGSLTNAANLTADTQLFSVAQWLCGL